MNSKERVLTAFDHQEPDRVPVWYGACDELTERLVRTCGVADEEALMQRLGIDFRRVRDVYVGPPLERPDGTRANFWGVERDGLHYGQPLSHPLAHVETVEQVEAHDWPSVDWFELSHLRRECEQWSDYAIIGGPWVVVFTDATELVGMEQFFMKMVTHPEVMHAVINKVSDFYYELAVRTFEACADRLDIFFFGDDMGTQQGLLISPDMWREFCKPHVKRFVDLGRQAGLRTMYHSCGAVREIIPDLIELGLEALNPIQVRAAGMDLAELKQEFGRELTFHGAFDHQQVLPLGTVDEVGREVRRVVDIMAPGGGFCLAPSHDLMLDTFPAENVIAMYDQTRAYGCYG
jgi:uroporphyrinogen decarboxylase